MRSLHFFSLWRPRSTLSTPSAFRVEVRPPSLRHAPSSWSQRLMFWLLAPAPQEAAPPINRLPVVKRDFLACLGDVEMAGADELRLSIGNARSLRELWHQRSDVYTLVARAHCEVQAGQRIDRLNRHFPTRAPRNGTGPSGPTKANTSVRASGSLTLLDIH